MRLSNRILLAPAVFLVHEAEELATMVPWLATHAGELPAIKERAGASSTTSTAGGYPMRMFARVLGVFLLIEGIWGLFSPVVFGVLTTNMLHAVIHIVLGIAGIVLASRAGARGYLLGVGGLLAVVGVLYFVPGVSGLIVSLLNVNFAVACFDIVVGLAAVAVALSSKQEVVVAV